MGADKAMAEQSNILDVVKQKLIQAATATTSAEGREAIRKDVSKLLDQMNNISAQTNYNGIYLLQADSTINGEASTELTFQMGGVSDNIIISDEGVQSNVQGLNLTELHETAELTEEQARGQMQVIDLAIDQLNSWRADFGSTQNQVESAVRNM